MIWQGEQCQRYDRHGLHASTLHAATTVQQLCLQLNTLEHLYSCSKSVMMQPLIPRAACESVNHLLE
jgi:hypothetical protein